MIIKLAPRDKRGKLLQKAESPALDADVEIKDALLLTGANGAGKTVLLNALAAGAGLARMARRSERVVDSSG